MGGRREREREPALVNERAELQRERYWENGFSFSPFSLPSPPPAPPLSSHTESLWVAMQFTDSKHVASHDSDYSIFTCVYLAASFIQLGTHRFH